MSEKGKMFEPEKNGLSNIGCRMKQRAWVALQEERLRQALHTWEIVDRITVKVRDYSLVRNVQTASLEHSKPYLVDIGN
jgi:hypothetical protein